MGTVPIGIGIGRCIGIGLGSVETLLRITIEPIFICIGIGIGIGIGVGQWKHTIRCKSLFTRDVAVTVKLHCEICNGPRSCHNAWCKAAF